MNDTYKVLVSEGLKKENKLTESNAVIEKKDIPSFSSEVENSFGSKAIIDVDDTNQTLYVMESLTEKSR